MTPDLAEITARIGAALLLAAAVAKLTRILPKAVAAFVAAGAVLAAAVATVGGFTAVEYLLSETAPLSAATLLFCARSLWRDLARPALPADRLGFRSMATIVLLLALAFYPSALGWRSYDPYALGYAGWDLPAVLMALLAAGYLLNSPAVAFWLCLCGALFLSGLTLSRNLWDAAIDPLAPFFALPILFERVRARSAAVPEVPRA